MVACAVLLLTLPLFVHAQAADAGRTVRIGVYQNPPKIYLEDGKAKGLWVDITDYIADKEGWNVEYVEGTWAEGLHRMETGEIDAMVDVAVSDERKKIYHYHDETVVVNWAEIYSPVDAQIDSVLDLENLKIAALDGGIHLTGPFGIQNLMSSFGLEAEFVPTDSYAGTFDLVTEGSADAAVVNRLFGTTTIADYEGLRPTGIVFNPIELRYALTKDGVQTDYLSERIDHWLDELKAYDSSIYYKAIDQLFGGKDEEGILVSQLEQEWLDVHDEVTIAFDGDYAPYSFETEPGMFVGVAVDFADRLSEIIGVEFSVYPDGLWKNLYDAAVNREVDVVATLVRRPERELLFEFTEPYISIDQYIITRNDYDDIGSRDDLSGKTLALVSSYSTTQLIVEEFPNITPLYVDNLEEALRSVSLGGADATVAGLGLAQYLIREQGMVNLALSDLYAEGVSEQRFGVRGDWPELASLLDKALRSMSETLKIEIFSEWIPVSALKKSFRLSEHEKLWLERHPEIRAGVDQQWVPFDYIEQDGSHAGICSEYLSTVADLIGLNVAVENELTWAQMMQKAEKGEIDVIPCIVATEERSEFLLFTEPFLSLSTVLVMRDDAPFINSLDQMKGETIAVVAGFSTAEWLQNDFPDIQQYSVNDFDEAVEAVSSGKVDGVIDTSSALTYAIRKTGVKNLRIATALPRSIDLSFGVSKDMPDLVPMIERALEIMTEEERALIHDSWVNVHFETKTDYSLLWKIVLAILVVSSTIVGFVIYVNRKLAGEVKKRKKAEAVTKQYQAGLVRMVQERMDALTTEKEKGHEAKKEIAALNEMRNKFVRIVSHQLRTPLNAVKWNLELLLDGSMGELTKEQLEMIRSSHEAEDNVISRIHDLLTIMDIEEGRDVTSKEDASIRTIWAGVLATIKEQAEAKKITVEYEGGIELPATIQIDRKKIAEVMKHLTDNALDYTKEGGVVSVTMRPDGNDVRFEITDNGIGIPEGEQNSIFTRFYRASNAFLVETDRSGLGLAISKYYVEQHGGEIGFDSKEGEGSTFWFTLPVTE